MNKADIVSTFVNDENRRMAEVFTDKYHYGVRMYEKCNKAWGYDQWVLQRTELLTQNSIHFAEDLAENYVQKWGAFRDGD